MEHNDCSNAAYSPDPYTVWLRDRHEWRQMHLQRANDDLAWQIWNFEATNKQRHTTDNHAGSTSSTRNLEELYATQSQLTELQEKFAKESGLRESLQKEKSDLEVRLGNRIVELDSLKVELGTKVSEAESLRSDLAAKDQEMGSLVARQSSENTVMAKTQADLITRDRELTDAQEQVTMYKQQVQKHEEACKLANASCEHLLKETDELREQKIQLEATLQEERAMYTQLQARYNELHASMSKALDERHADRLHRQYLKQDTSVTEHVYCYEEPLEDSPPVVEILPEEAVEPEHHVDGEVSTISGQGAAAEQILLEETTSSVGPPVLPAAPKLTSKAPKPAFQSAQPTSQAKLAPWSGNSASIIFPDAKHVEVDLTKWNEHRDRMYKRSADMKSLKNRVIDDEGWEVIQG